jgi:hypothetical protein
MQTKKQRKQTEEGFPVQSFPTLLQALATRCRNTRQVQATKEAPTFEQITRSLRLRLGKRKRSSCWAFRVTL